MLEKLQRKIEEHNNNVQLTIDKVATRQKFITIGAIAINLLILFLTNYFLPDDSEDVGKRSDYVSFKRPVEHPHHSGINRCHPSCSSSYWQEKDY